MKITKKVQPIVLSFFERQNESLVLAGCFVTVCILGAADYLTGYEIAFAIFYVVPIAVAAYFVGRSAAIAISVLAAAIWLAADVGSGHQYTIIWAPYWNAFTRFLFFVIVAICLSALRSLLAQERTLARSDFLTGAVNSRAFYELAEVELDRARRYRRPFSIAHIDVDNFKTVNDTLGHHAGDDLLCVIVNTMQSQLRKSDVVARLGGDEFALLLPETAADQAAIAVRILNDRLGEAVGRRNWPVTFSVGLLTCMTAPQSVNEVLKRADELTYDAKRSGKNAIRQGVFSREAGSADAAASTACSPG